MKTITFTYEKSDSSISERTLMVLKEPNEKYYAGIDLSELDPTVAAQFVTDYNTLHEEFLAKAVELQKKYDLKYKYRQFLVSGMRDIVEI